MTRDKGEAEPLLFQPMPPLDLACLRDCQKNAFIIPQNMTARIFSVQVHHPIIIFIFFLLLGFSLQYCTVKALSYLSISKCLIHSIIINQLHVKFTLQHVGEPVDSWALCHSQPVERVSAIKRDEWLHVCVRSAR